MNYSSPLLSIKFVLLQKLCELRFLGKAGKSVRLVNL